MPGFACGVSFLDKLQGIVVGHQDFPLRFPLFVDRFSLLYEGVY